MSGLKQNLDLATVLKTTAVACTLLARCGVAQGDAHKAEFLAHAARISPSEFTQTQAAGQALHIVVGRSTFIGTRERLRRVYVANPAVLDSYTASPYQIVVTAKAPGFSSLILWDEMGQSQSYQISSDVDVEALSLSMRQALPTENVQVRGSEGRVLLTGMVSNDALSDAAVKLASLYSKDVSNSLVINRAQIKQVKLKVRIVEVDRSRLSQFGVNFFSQGGSVISGTTTSQFPSNAVLSNSGTTGPLTETLSVSDPLNFLLFSSKLNVGVSVKDLENKQVLQVLAEPTIVTMSGQKADFLAGGEFPFPIVQGGTAGLSSISIQFRPYGVKVEFTPFVNADGTIELKVAPEVSALDYANAVSISGYTIPAISTRRAETQVVLRSGQSFAISGLLDRRTTDLLGRTPGIAAIPVLGQLFRSKGITHSTSELIVIVTPTVIDPLSDTTSPTEPATVIPLLDTQTFDKTLPNQPKKK